MAKVIASRDILETERDVFVVQQGQFDTHTDLHEGFNGQMAEINSALEQFVAEMKATGIWEQVTIISQSDFGRTLTSKGVGTDHAWAGHHFYHGWMPRTLSRI
eukprot:COSAG05_NODE_228_length_13388_cov_2.850403_7_plen_103_part_00